MSWAARPDRYTLKRDIETTFAARMMRWGGVLLAIFIVFHILQFTLGAVGFSPGQFKDLQVYENVVAGFSVWPVAVFYIVAMGALCLHLDHGIWSMLQTPAARQAVSWPTSALSRLLWTSNCWSGNTRMALSLDSELARPRAPSADMRREFLSTFLRTMRCLTGKFFVIQRSLFEDSGRQIVLISPAFVVVGSVHAVVIWLVICFSSFRRSRLQKISDFLREPLRAAACC
jgi:succinate dehydrogenase/fumarate reductase cytochrome b subunit